MRAKIKRNNDGLEKYVVVTKYEDGTRHYDVTQALSDAIRYWLWNMDMKPKIAFFWKKTG